MPLLASCRAARNHRFSTRNLRRRWFAATLALPALLAARAVPGVHAASFNWTGGSGQNGNWSTATNWAGKTMPANDGTSDVIFSGAITNNVSYLDQNYLIHSLRFDGTQTSFYVENSNNAVLQLGGSGLLQTSSRNQEVDAPIVLSTSQTWTNTAASLSGNGNVTGSGTLTLGGVVSIASLTFGGQTLNLNNTAPTSFQQLDLGYSDSNGHKADGSVNQNAGNVTIANLANGSFSTYSVVQGGGQGTTVTPEFGHGYYSLNGGTLKITGTVSDPGIMNYGKGSTDNDYFMFNGGTLLAAHNGSLLGGIPITQIGSGGAFIDTQGYNATLSGQLVEATGTGGSLTKLGNGTLTLGTGYTGYNSSLTTYSGATNVNAGTLQMSSSGTLPGTSTVTVAAGATLDLNGTSQSIGNLAGAGTVNDSNSSPASISVQAGQFDGSIQGTVGLTKSGGGTLVLDGLNSYTGATLVSGGTLALQNGGELSQTPVRVSGGAFNVDGGDAQVASLTVAGGSLLVDGGYVVSGGGVVVDAASTTAATPAATLGSGGITTGSLTVGNSFAGNFVQSGGTNAVNGTLTLGSAAGASGSYNLSGGSVTAQSTVVGGAGAGTVIQTGGSAGFGNLTVAGSGATGTISQSGGTATAANVTVGGGGTGTYNLGGGSLAASGSVIVGLNSAGTFNVTGGSFSMPTNYTFYLGQGSAPGTSGTFNLSGSTSSVTAGVVSIGVNGAGVANQGGGVWNSTLFGVGGDVEGFTGGGAGTFNLGGGTANTGNVAVGTGGTGVINQTGGVLNTGTSVVIFDALGTADSGTYNLTGGVLQTGRLLRGYNGTGILNFNGGTLRATASSTSFLVGLSSVNVQGGGGRIDTGGFNDTVGQILAHDPTLGGSGDGGLTKLGVGTLTLTAANTYTGGTTVAGGTLSVDRDAELGAAAGAVTLTGNGQLAITGTAFNTARTFNLNFGTLAPVAGATLTYNGATVNGGFLRGSGQVVGSGGASFNGTTAYGDTVITQNGPATFTNFSSSAALTSNGALTWDGGVQNGAGRWTINKGVVASVDAFESDGVTTINNGGTLANTAGSLVLGGGSRTTINSGGTLSAATGTTIELNGAFLVNSGKQVGTLDVNYGSTAKGTGTFGTVNVGDGGRFGTNVTASGAAVGGLNVIHLTGSMGLVHTTFVGPQLMVTPGTANVVNLALGSGSVFAFSVQDAQGAAGSGYDTAHASGTLTLAAGTAAGSQITISVASLNGSGTAGPASNFDPSHNSSFVLVQADGGIGGYQTGEFVVDTSAFQNATDGGSFSVMQQGSNLDLVFTSAVPEPSTWALLGVGAAGLGLMTLRRRRTA